MRQIGWLWLAIGFSACQSKSTSEDTEGTTTTDPTTEVAEEEEEGDSRDSGGTTSPDGFPAQPAPFTITLDGASTASLTFDDPTCSHRTGSASIRFTWRGASHFYILVVEMFDTFPGEAGAYTASDGVRVRLQEEAGGMGAYFDSNFDGVGATLTLDGFDTTANHAWGSATIGSLGDGSGGVVTTAPDLIPIWCDSME
ncbi:MAG TPA: hypothetical protein DFR83_20615 [Deltaproteobacteria bacterium]|nr:hypothetical protein [Deltaproteobacteria bacterium]